MVQTPDWVKDAVFYQIFPDRFAKSPELEPQKPNNLEPWDSPPTVHGYKGGDLIGVLEHLDHIQNLGANALYFCPIFQSASNHRYHTHDYLLVDPLLGGNAAFARLLDEAHQRGLRVVLDGVFNHASRGFFQFSDVLENGRASPYVDWFTFTSFPPNAFDHARPPGYWAWWNMHALPKLRTENPQVREFLMRVAETWLRLGIDGWRLDVPQEISTPGFWEEFRQRVKAVNPEAYIVGEIWDPAPDFLRGDRFDGVMNYPFAEATLAFAGGHRVDPRMAEGRGYRPQFPIDARGYAERVGNILRMYPWEIQLAQMNLLDSHDTARAITLCGGDQASVRLATLLLLTYPGAVCFFAGDEIGQEGGLPDYDTRRSFPWDRPETWRLDTLAYHRELIRLRRELAVLRRGSYETLLAEGPLYAFARHLDGQTLVTVVNTAEASVDLQLPLGNLAAAGTSVRALYPRPDLMPWGSFEAGAQAGKVREVGLPLTLAPRSGVILAFD